MLWVVLFKQKTGYEMRISDWSSDVCSSDLLVIDVNDALYTGAGQPIGETDYETLLAGGDPDFPWEPPADEWDAICLNYTSGTTGNPKGVLYHHRGAYTNAISNILEWYRSEEHTSELQSLMRISYAVF